MSEKKLRKGQTFRKRLTRKLGGKPQKPPNRDKRPFGGPQEGSGRPVGAGTFKDAYQNMMALASAFPGGLKKALQDALEGKSIKWPGGDWRRPTGFEMLAGVSLLKALSGSERSLDSVMDRIDGKAIQTQRTIGDQTGGLHITITAEGSDEAEGSGVEVRAEKVEVEPPTGAGGNGHNGNGKG
jgi:hypothetical protein